MAVYILSILFATNLGIGLDWFGETDLVVRTRRQLARAKEKLYRAAGVIDKKKSRLKDGTKYARCCVTQR